MRLLSLDIGTRRTGAAFGDTDADIIMALNTIHHTTTDELSAAVEKIVTEKGIQELFIGLPLLPSGGEGEQALLVREMANTLMHSTGLPVTFIDERYTTDAMLQKESDAKAACEILEIAIQKRRKGIDL